ncbi:MAG TPA: adenylate/guanylate cyclase domain-containing protein [Solirubrobacterales bacterium]|nr:adenylate/guanylate cyclase domain-containing protein [Solirubrobacterales bacterium]
MSGGRRSKQRKGKGEDPAERLLAAGEQLAARGKRLNRDPRLLAIVRSLRRVLPGDDRVADPAELSRNPQPRAVSRMLSEISSDRPGVLGEAGLGALQVWQSISEAQGRGKGKTELAIVFTDLVDFSDWALQAGDEAAVDLLRDVSVAVEPPVKSNDGEVVKRLGDGMMAVFKTAEAGLAAILEGRERLADLDVDGYEPRVRAGLHVGKPRKVGKDYFGVDVNIAARIADGAEPGEVLVSDAALESVGPKAVSVEERPLLDAKGVPEDFRVYAVTVKR